MSEPISSPDVDRLVLAEVYAELFPTKEKP